MKRIILSLTALATLACATTVQAKPPAHANPNPHAHPDEEASAADHFDSFFILNTIRVLKLLTGSDDRSPNDWTSGAGRNCGVTYPGIGTTCEYDVVLPGWMPDDTGDVTSVCGEKKCLHVCIKDEDADCGIFLLGCVATGGEVHGNKKIATCVDDAK